MHVPLPELTDLKMLTRERNAVWMSKQWKSSCKVVTTDSSNPEKPTHHMLLLSFVIILQSYAPQTKILEVRTNILERIFEVILK